MLVRGQAAGLDNALGKSTVAHFGGKGDAHSDVMVGWRIYCDAVAGLDAAGGNNAQISTAIATGGPTLEPPALP